MATAYQKIGSGIEEMTTALNYEVTTTTDVIGTTVTKATKGANTITVDPITINPNSYFAKWVDTAIERQYDLSDLELQFLFVKMYKTVGGKPVAFRQTAVVVPQDWATGNQDLRGSVELNLIGTREFGTVDFESATGDKFIPETGTDGEPVYSTGDAKREEFAMYYIHETT